MYVCILLYTLCYSSSSIRFSSHSHLEFCFYFRFILSSVYPLLPLPIAYRNPSHLLNSILFIPLFPFLLISILKASARTMAVSFFYFFFSFRIPFWIRTRSFSFVASNLRVVLEIPVEAEKEKKKSCEALSSMKMCLYKRHVILSKIHVMNMSE